MDCVNNIAIVGGGTAGLTTALILKKAHPNVTITVLESTSIGIIGVGEGSTEHWSEFLYFCNLDVGEMLRNTDATVKTGIKFVNWNGDNTHYWHSVTTPYDSTFTNYFPSYFSYIIANGIDHNYMYPAGTNESMFQKTDYVNQYHFDTFKLNAWLHKKCIERGIVFVDAVINDVILDNDGYIKELVDITNTNYAADFFVDASGFNKVLMNKLGCKWIDWQDYLPMNRAIAFPTDYEEDIDSHTTSTALSSGWTWKIPTQQRHGNGYVFCDDYITVDDAITEVETHRGHKIDVAKDIKFSAGRIDYPLRKNCVAVGLASIFVEPLEASSIGCSIQQGFGLSAMLLNYSKGNNSVELRYNKIFSNVFDNILNFVQLHYFTKRNDTKFWKDKPFKLTDFNKETQLVFKDTLPSLLFFNDPYVMFKESSWILVMYGLGLFNIESIKKRWIQQPEAVRNDIKTMLDQIRQSELNILSHRQMIDRIKYK